MFAACLLRGRRANAGEVRWLAEVQQPPKIIPRDDAGRLDPLLIDGSGRPIRSLDEWTKQRQSLRERWLQFLGPMPDRPADVALKILREDRLARCVRQLVQYESEPGMPVEGYLLRPAEVGEKRRAAIVALHPTSRKNIEEIAGVVGLKSRHTGLKLAQRGFVVFCPRCFLWQNAENDQQAVDQFRGRHPDTLGMHKMLFDAMRGVDVMQSLPEVDPKRIGAAGHSLGAKEALYLAAFDQRVQATVASEGGVGFRFTNWNAPWYLGKTIEEPDFALNHHQLLALAAPRAVLILAGESGRGAADGDRSWPFIETALPVYELYGRPARIGLLNHRQGHQIPPRAFDRMVEWLDTYLEG